MYMESFNFHRTYPNGQLQLLKYTLATTPSSPEKGRKLAEGERELLEGLILDELIRWEPRPEPIIIETKEEIEYQREFGFMPPRGRISHPTRRPSLITPLTRHLNMLLGYLLIRNLGMLNALLYQNIPLNGDLPRMTLVVKPTRNERALRLHERIWRHPLMGLGEPARAGCAVVASLPR